jgi:hypothetical protein
VLLIGDGLPQDHIAKKLIYFKVNEIMFFKAQGLVLQNKSMTTMCLINI